jgi:hypothetical protein
MRSALVASLATALPLNAEVPSNKPLDILSVRGEKRDGGGSGRGEPAETKAIGAIGPTPRGPDTGSVTSRIHSVLTSGAMGRVDEAEEEGYPEGGDRNEGDPSNDGGAGGGSGNEGRSSDDEDEELEDEVAVRGEGAGGNAGGRPSEGPAETPLTATPTLKGGLGGGIVRLWSGSRSESSEFTSIAPSSGSESTIPRPMNAVAEASASSNPPPLPARGQALPTQSEPKSGSGSMCEGYPLPWRGSRPKWRLEGEACRRGEAAKTRSG